MKALGHIKAAAICLLLGACATGTPSADPGIVSELPEGVRAIAGPGQNLSVVRIMPEDGCYWYQWVGPVETTFLPLRTAEGRMICTRPNDPVLTGV